MKHLMKKQPADLKERRNILTCHRKCLSDHRELPMRQGSRGSLTVEASFAVPLFFLCMVTMICFMDIYGAAVRQTMRLQQAAEKAGYAAGIAGNDHTGVIDIRIPVIYRPKWLPVPISGIIVASRGRVRPWTGRDSAQEKAAGSRTEERMVYVTENRSVYHTNASCTHISLDIEAVSFSSTRLRRNADGEKYHACEKCTGSGHMGTVVYISREGNRYHNSPECSGLTRSVRLIPIHEAGGLRMCSRCQAGEHGRKLES